MSAKRKENPMKSRLTIKTNESVAIFPPNAKGFPSMQDALSKLAEYEDICTDPAILRDCVDRVRMARMIELAAPNDGLLVHETDPQPLCFYSQGGDLCPGLAVIGDDEPMESCKRCWYCEGGYAHVDTEDTK